MSRDRHQTATTVQQTLLRLLLRLVVSFLLLETASSSALLILYRIDESREQALAGETSAFSSVNLVRLLLNRVGERATGDGAPSFQRRATPVRYLQRDEVLGFSARPGWFTDSYRNTPTRDERSTRFEIEITVSEAGRRWSGPRGDQATSQIHLLGDSYVFGRGVHDLQTFAALLQHALPEREVVQHALPGYGFAQTYLVFLELEERLTAADVLVLGYGDCFDRRTVGDSSHYRRVARRIRETEPSLAKEPRPRARVRLTPDGTLVAETVESNCLLNPSACTEPEVEARDGTKVTLAILRHIRNRHEPGAARSLVPRGSQSFRGPARERKHSERHPGPLPMRSDAL